MKMIFASTLYKASKNKEHIKSALANPKNGELVQQLREYLDDDTLEELRPEPEPEFDFDAVDDAVDSVDTDMDAESVAKDNDVSKPATSKPSPAKFTSKSDHMEDLKEFESNMDDFTEEPSQDSPESATPSQSDEAVESAVEVEDVKESIDTNAIQGSLNSREDTAGVSYILIKDGELWIHYKDDINLNNVMEDVIKWFRDTCYDNLTFNRLARAANAIVFEIVNTNINNYSMSKETNA